jgi:hypothetical protein
MPQVEPRVKGEGPGWGQGAKSDRYTLQLLLVLQILLQHMYIQIHLQICQGGERLFGFFFPKGDTITYIDGHGGARSGCVTDRT